MARSGVLWLGAIAARSRDVFEAVLGSGLPEDPRRDRAGYVDATLTEDWSVLARTGRAVIEASEARLVAARSQYRDLAAVLARLEQGLPSVRRQLREPLVGDAEAAEIRRGLQTRWRDEGLNAAEIRRRLQRLEAPVLVEAADGLHDRGRLLAELTYEQARSAAGRRCGGLLAEAVAVLNDPGDLRGGRWSADSADAWLTSTGREVDRKQRTLHRRLANGRLEEAWVAATDLALSAEAELASAARFAASSARRRERRRDETEDLRACRLGDAARALLRAAALGWVSAQVSAGHVEVEPTRSWVQAANSLSATARRSPAARRSVSTLAARRQPVGDRLLRVRGTVTEVEVEHRAGKPVSRARLDDGEHEITVGLTYIKLDSGGIVPGAAVEVGGRWQEVDWADGPLLVLDRRDRSAEATRSWAAWVDLELREVFEPSPHGVAASWSWQPGVDGAGNPLRYGVWAAAPRTRRWHA